MLCSVDLFQPRASSCERILQAELGKQDRRPWCCPWKCTLPTRRGTRKSASRLGRTAVWSQEGPDPPDSTAQFCRVLQGLSGLQLSPCPTGDSVSAAQSHLMGWAASLPWWNWCVCILPTGWAFTSLMRKFNHEAKQGSREH